VRTAYKCRAYPDPVQASVLNRTFGCVRVVWNRTLAWRRRRHQEDKTGTTFAQANGYLTAMKATEELAWLNEVSSVPLQQTIRHQQAAYTAFFAKMDAPLAFTWSWPGIDPATVPATGRVAEVDLGVTDFAVTSDGQRITNPRHLERRARNLARYQRRLARCQPGSANRGKARAKAARAHRKVRAARTDFLHRTSTGLVRHHDVIVLEDLAVKNIVRNRRLAKAISDCGWGTFRAMLEYKAARTGRHLIVIDRWYPSTKTCSACGYLLASLSLNTRTWQCPSCGTRHDRDHNATKNILAAGRAVAGDTPGHACGADVRHSGSSQGCSGKIVPAFITPRGSNASFRVVSSQ
jgi:putative transposase